MNMTELTFGILIYCDTAYHMAKVAVVVVLLLFYVHDKHLWSCRDKSVGLTTLFLGRLKPPKQLTTTSCTYFRQ